MTRPTFKYKIIPLLTLVFSIAHYIQAFTPFQTKVDSLRNLIEIETEDTVKYNLYSALSTELFKEDRSSAVGPLKELCKLAYLINDDSKIADAESKSGTNYLWLGLSDSAKTHIQNAITFYGKLDNLQQLSNNLNNLALIYQRSNQYEEAIETYHQVIVYSDSLNDYVGSVYSYINLMSVYMDLDDPQKALEYKDEIEKIFRQVPDNIDEKERVDLDGSHAGLYLNTGLCHFDDGKGNLDSAQYYYNKAEDGLDNLTSDYVKTYWKGYIDNGYGQVSHQLAKNHSSVDSIRFYNRQALGYFLSAYNSFEKAGEERGQAFALNNIGMVQNALGQYRQAENRLKTALSISQRLNFKEEIRDSYKYLADNAEAFNKHAQANKYLREWITYKDSINDDNRIKFATASDIRFQTAQKEKEITELALQNELNAQKSKNQLYIVIGSALFLLALAYVIFARFRFRKQREKVEFERSVNQAMSRFVPMAFIKAIGRDKITDVELGDQIEKEVTVVFTDIRSFTTISEGMTPKENFAFVKEYAERMGPIIERNGGFISQYLGDGIMAIFQNSPSDALIACIEMQQDIEHYNEELSVRGRAPIKVGMGMHTGPLIMGIIGDETRRDATLISDTVNTAARIENTTKTLNAEILISEDSVKRLKEAEHFKLTAMGEITIKGKNLPIQVYKCAKEIAKN